MPDNYVQCHYFKNLSPWIARDFMLNLLIKKELQIGWEVEISHLGMCNRCSYKQPWNFHFFWKCVPLIILHWQTLNTNNKLNMALGSTLLNTNNKLNVALGSTLLVDNCSSKKMFPKKKKMWLYPNCHKHNNYHGFAFIFEIKGYGALVKNDLIKQWILSSSMFPTSLLFA
jgi:hypothetical protein